MRIIYNGIDLGVIDTEQFESVPVLDETGTDYLYTRHTIVVRAVVNGQVELTSGPGQSPTGALNGPPISYRRTGSQVSWSGINTGSAPPGVNVPGNATPPAVGVNYLNNNVVPAPTSGRFFGVTPGDDGVYADNSGASVGLIFTPTPTTMTYAQIYRRLTVNQGMLWVFAGPGITDGVLGNNDVLIQSPQWGARVDCTNGPKVRVLGISEVNGDATTFQVYFAVETTTNDVVGEKTNNPQFLLSNRFSQLHHLVDDAYLTIVTTGTAIFRTDWVYGALQNLGAPGGINPDSIRPYFMQPIPQGFVRENIEVMGLPDVTGVRYSYADRQQPSNFVAGPYIRAASITAFHRQAVTSGGDILGGVLGAYERVLGIRANKEIARGTAGTPRRAAHPLGTSTALAVSSALAGGTKK